MATLLDRLLTRLSGPFPGLNRETLMVRAFALRHIPLMALTRPLVREFTDERCVVRLPLDRLTRNHLGSLYLGALVIGADVAGGLIAQEYSQRRNIPISLVFSNLKAEFLRRADGDVDFTCCDGAALHALVDEIAVSGERKAHTVEVVATVPASGPEPVARLWLTLSLKRRSAGSR